jgi:Flp pilus assembly protein TadD
MSFRLRWIITVVSFWFTVVLCQFSAGPVVFAAEPQWIEVKSPNFSVVTDAGEKRGREVAMRFEQMRAVYGILITKAKVNLPIPLQIVAFRNTKEMRQVAPLFNGKPTEVAGLFQGGQDRSFIMLDMSVENPYSIVFHEYAHQLLNGNITAPIDPWFEEGFAEYFSSIEVDNKEARVGKIPLVEYQILREFGVMKIADLFRVRQNSSTYNESGDHRSTFYAESGMLTHYIYDNQLLSKVGDYFELVVNKRVPVENAIQQAFGMSAPQFDKVLYNYMSEGRYKYYPIHTLPGIDSATYKVTGLKATESAGVLADIHLHSRDYQGRAMTEFQEILKSDPNDAAACRGLGFAYLQKQDFHQAADYFRRASQLNSSDPRVHYYIALLMFREQGFGAGADLAEMTRELETSVNLDPTFADSYSLLAFAQTSAGDNVKALATMQKAIAISPRNAEYRFNLANLYVMNHQVDNAIAVLQALRGTDSPGLASRVEAALQQAQQFQQAMRDGGSNGLAVRRTDEGSVTQSHEQGLIPAASAPSSKAIPAKFLKGMLTSADCTTTPPSALLTVTSGKSTWKMTVPDRNHLVLIGADEFSCSWNKEKVAVNYRETAEGQGSVISLEIQ